MDFFELSGSEQNEVYQQVALTNTYRHYDFLYSMVKAAIDSERPWLSESLIKAINFHAIVGLHHEAGQYRSHDVVAGSFTPPEHYRVEPLMEDFVNRVNWRWQASEFAELSAYALWRINHIHPFRNGNGRTARAVCYFIICVKSGGLLPGTPTVPELLRRDSIRAVSIEALREADRGDLSHLTTLVRQVTAFQLSQANPN